MGKGCYLGKQIQPSRPPSLQVQTSSKLILAPSVLIKSKESRHLPSRKCLDFWPFLVGLPCPTNHGQCRVMVPGWLKTRILLRLDR